MQDTSSESGPDSPTDARQITLLEGSQTGNATWLAGLYAARLEEHGYRVTCCSMSQFPDVDLTRADTLLVLIGTFVNGEPPDSAAPFCRFLLEGDPPSLQGLRYSVLALGDTTYKDCFCTIGRRLDARLERLGAERFYPRVECDVDFEETADAWFEGVLDVLLNRPHSEQPAEDGKHVDSPAGTGVPVSIRAATIATQAATAKQATSGGYSRKNPFPAKVLENRNLNGPGSDRETRHLRLSLEDSGFAFEPGDSLGIYPTNHPRLVEELIGELGYDGDERVVVGQERHTLRDALSRHCEITVATGGLAEQFREWSKAGQSGVPETGQPRSMAGRDLLDLVRDFSLRGIPAQQLVSALRRLPARLYSFANCPRAHPDEAHVTISALRYRSGGRDRYGVCSVECAERIQPGDRLPVYVNANPYFRLPADPSTPVIMVGPGTGCAPFRAFLQQREQCGAKGNNWFFFGVRRQATDFLYRDDWHAWQRRGLLTRLDVAFSRDTPQKAYVQHLMNEHGKELFAWLEQGAHLYVAGDEKRMAPAVHQTLLEIVRREGGRDQGQAEDYVNNLQRDRRYQRDLY